MKSSVVAVIIVACVVLLGAGAFFLTRDSDGSDTTVTTSTQPTRTQRTTPETQDASTNDEATASDAAGPITKEQVALHNTEGDCWTIIDGSVYDITSYIPRHPGGDNILSACGSDATAFFNGEKAGQNGGTNDHSGDSQATKQLESLKLGELSN